MAGFHLGLGDLDRFVVGIGEPVQQLALLLGVVTQPGDLRGQVLDLRAERGLGSVRSLAARR